MDCSRSKICCFIIILILIGIYLVVTETDLFKKKESTFERDVPKCIPVFEEANSMIGHEIESSKRILDHPDAYANISKKCEEAIECSKLSGIDMKTYHLNGKYNPCMFFASYNGQFSTCARLLLKKIGDQIDCIETVFNGHFKSKHEKCEAWKKSEQCFVRAILNACDTIGGARLAGRQSKKEYYSNEINNLTPAFCDEIE